MSLFNIFDPKKKPLKNQSTQIQASGMTSNYAGNPTIYQSGSYSTPSKTPTPSPVPTPAPAQNRTQSSYSPVSSIPSGQNMSKAPIQGSGMTSAYASNPTNYKPITSVPTPQPQPQPQKQSANSAWMDYVTQATERQRQLAEQQGQQSRDFITQKYDLANRQLGEQLPAAQETFNRFKGNTEATIADLISGGERQKEQAKDYYGDAQRQAAQTLRETQGQTQKTFANLGTLDSRGEGSFAQSNENTMSDFNRYTQQTLKAQADQLSEIDMQVSQAERSARDTIATEEAKMSELARNIQYAIANNNLQQAQELTQAFNQSQQYIYDIEDALAQTKYQFALEQEKLQNAMKQAQSFTPEFMATGQPTNQAEYEYFIKNKDAMESLYGGGDNTSSKKVSDIVGQLLKMNTQGITGKMRIGFSDESRAAEGLLKQLSSELQIEEARRLKGQGTMSDAERSILANSIAAFNLDKNGKPNVSDERFRQILSDLQANTGVSNQSTQTIRVIQNSTGQTGTIPANEFDPSLYTQI